MDVLNPQMELQQLLDEQQRITALIQEERRWWQEIREIGKPRFGEMGTRLQRLRVRLAGHFEHEESAEQTAAGRGASPEQALEMQTAHRQLMARLDQMIARTDGCQDAYECWGEVGREFSDLIHDLETHEKSELELLAAILNAPPGSPISGSLPS